MGRPPKNPTDVASETVGVRFTPSERASCEAAAKRAKLRLSHWVRDRLLQAAKTECSRPRRKPSGAVATNAITADLR